jgi:hypothetical protein
MMKKNNTKFVCIFKTGKLYELDMAVNALTEKKIPFYREEVSSSGLRFAMPFQPSMGPGTWFAIIVPEVAVNEARNILEGLPFKVSNNPDIWHFGASKKERAAWRIYAWITLISTLLILVSLLIKYLNDLLK